MPDNTLSTLAQIKTKVRKITRSPSTTLLSDDTLRDYINNFVLYDLAERLRLYNLETTVTIYTRPNVDRYPTNTTVGDPLNINKIISFHEPVRLAGRLLWYSQDREIFFAAYNNNETKSSVGTGDGATSNFSGTLSGIPVVQERVYFSSVNAAGAQLIMHDVPVVDTNGKPTQDGNLYAPGSEPDTAPTTTLSGNTINYVTGVFSVTFNNDPSDNNPASDEDVNANTVEYTAARPTGLLYDNGVFFLRPVPDKVYRLDIQARKRPTELLEDGEAPELSEWWELIAFGASLKIFEDRMDMESVQMIRPIFDERILLAERRTLVQQSNQRVSTIYSSSLGGFGPDGDLWPGGGVNGV